MVTSQVENFFYKWKRISTCVLSTGISCSFLTSAFKYVVGSSQHLSVLNVCKDWNFFNVVIFFLHILLSRVTFLQRTNVNVKRNIAAAKNLNCLFVRSADSETLPKYVRLEPRQCISVMRIRALANILGLGIDFISLHDIESLKIK